MTTDFAQLYLQLGISNDCTLEEFKQACRRRIRQQHPDRIEATGNPEATQVALAELLALYAKALRFHRRHGRLPGAIAPSSNVTAMINTGLRPTPSQRPLLSTPHAAGNAVIPTATRQRSWRSPILVLAATIAGFAAINAWNESESAEEATPAVEASLPSTVEPTPVPADTTTPGTDAGNVQEDGQPLVAPPRLIEIGMDAETVRSLQGDPMQWEGSEWIYGPSWIRFERGRVIDWYSSPLHRLKTETTSP